MLYGVAQSGPNITSPGLNIAVLYPGDPYTLFDGTEVVASNLKSVAFQRGPSPAAGDSGMSFYAVGMASDMVIDIQAAARDVEADYGTVWQITADSAGKGQYTDIGRGLVYRAVISTYSTGTMPTLRVQR
jgi:hypothetical protein